MKKPLLILLALAAVAVAAYLGCYRLATRETRRMLGEADGMTWLCTEFHLAEDQARAVAKLQADYEPHCMAMCSRITQSAGRLGNLLQESTVMTPELEKAVREASQTEADCRTATLAQAFAISAHMAPEQAVRYRKMVVGRIAPKHSHPGMCGQR